MKGMKLSEKQKEILLKFGTMKFSYMRLTSHWFQPDGRMFFVHENKMGVKNLVRRLYNKGFLKMENGETEEIYSLNPLHNQFISELKGKDNGK